ncbi:MAG: hypothetical protein H0U45_12460 [Tatlockia sp.]|nr:hypothetical protein [Tatlockia sp.]
MLKLCTKNVKLNERESAIAKLMLETLHGNVTALISNVKPLYLPHRAQLN